MADFESKPLVAELSNVTLAATSAHRRTAVTGLNWRISEGDFWVVTTTQHAGQQELLFTATGLQKPEAGRVTILGRDTSDLGQTRWFEERLGIGVVFEQGGRVLGSMTVAENVSLPLRYHRDSYLEELQSEIVPILEATELLPYAARTPCGMSAGWQHRVALARALALRPRLVFLERPLAHIEWQHKAWWLSFIPRLASGEVFPERVPVTLVVVTDDARPWVGLARQFAVLRRDEWRVLDGAPDLDPAGWLESPTE